MPYVNVFSELEDVGPDKPWCDLLLEIVEYKTLEAFPGFADTSTIVGHALGTANGVTVGIGFAVPIDSWHASRDAKPPFFHWSQVALTSLGCETAALIRIYESWFDIPAIPFEAAQLILCSAVALEDGRPKPAERDTRIKLFFEPRPDEDATNQSVDSDPAYAELFFNLDLGQRRLRLHEKDPEYRRDLLAYLRNQTQSVPSVFLHRPED
jgi:hypothetical protein